MAAELRNYDPSWSEKFAELISKGLGGGDETRSTAEWGRKLGNLAEMIPPVGAAMGANRGQRAAERGDFKTAAIEGGLGMLGGLGAPFSHLSKERAILGHAPYERVPGMPKEFTLPSGETIQAKPIPGIIDAMDDYAKSRGQKAMVPERFEPLDRDRAKQIANEYDVAPMYDPAAIASYKALADETLGQFDALKGRGYEFDFMKQGPDGGIIDPYAKNPAMGYKDLAENKRLQIFPTEGGYGTDAAFADHLLLQQSGRSFGDQPATYNDLFRAVHDAYGHFGHGNAFFRAPGEERAWGAHSAMYSPEARPTMTAETRGQNSWVNSGPHAEANAKASGAETHFADQEMIGMSPAAQFEGAPKLRPHGDPYVGALENAFVNPFAAWRED